MIGALRRPGVRLALLGAGAYLVFLVANLPAAWLGSALERSSGGALALGEPRGTVWKGSGVLALRSGGAYRGLADIEWRCNPLSVFVGRLSIALSGAGSETRVRAGVNLGAGKGILTDVEVNVPDQYMGDVIGDLTSKRARILGMEQSGAGMQRVRAHVPMAEMAHYATSLRSITQGRGSFHMKVLDYEQVPAHIADRVVEAAKKARQEDGH